MARGILRTSKKILGKNFAVAPYPTIKLDGKDVQMQAFLGIATFAVNSHASGSNQKAAATLASFITNKESQLIVYDHSGQIPVDKTAQKRAAKLPVIQSLVQ